MSDHAKSIRQDLRQSVPGHASRTIIHKIAWRFGFLFKKYGWKLVVVVVAYYLVRDTTVYVLIPYLVAKNVISR